MSWIVGALVSLGLLAIYTAVLVRKHRVEILDTESGNAIRNFFDRFGAQWTVLLVALGTFVLLLAFAGKKSLWYDDLAQLGYVAPPQSIGDVYHTITHTDIFMPPLSFVVTYLWVRIAPYGTAWLKLPSIVFFMLSVFLLGRLCLRLGGKRLGLIAAVLAGNCTFMVVTCAYTLRAYSLLVLFATALLWMYAKRLSFTGKERWQDVAGYAVALLLLTYTHYFGVFVVAALGLTDLILLRYKRITLRAAWGYVLWGILFLPWFVVIFMRAEAQVPVFGAEAVGVDAVLVIFRRLSGDFEPMMWCLALAMLLIACAMAGALRTKRLEAGTAGLVRGAALVCVGVVLAVPYVYSVYLRPERGLFTDRYFNAMAPMVLLLTASGLDWICEGLNRIKLVPRAGTITCVFACLLLCANGYSHLSKAPCYSDEPHEQAADWIYAQEKAHRPDAVTVVRHGYPGGTDYYFTHGNTRPAIPLIAEIDGQEERLLDARYVYLNQQHSPLPKELVAFMEQNFVLVEEHAPLGIWVYERKAEL